MPAWPRSRRWVLPALGLVALLLRAQLLDHPSAFMDEALNVAYGRLFLAHPLSPPLQETLYWHNGWFLWPAAAALADAAGGLFAQRLLAALLGAGTCVLVGRLGARLFSREVGWAAALFYALLAPAVFAASLGEYDAAAMAALAGAACVLARACDEDRRGQWLLGAALLFAAFLCKYVAAIFFPPLVILAALRSRRSISWLFLPLAAACAAYAIAYRAVLANVALVLSADAARMSLSARDLWSIYVLGRAELWVLVALALAGLARGAGSSSLAGPTGPSARTRLAALCGLAALVPLLRFVSPASDVRFPKHAAYALIFLCPAAAEGLRRLLRDPRWFAACAAALALALGTVGHSFRVRKLIFWPDLSAAAAFLEGRLDPRGRLLTNDLGLLHDVSPPLPFHAVGGPYAFRLGSLAGQAAWARALADGAFDYLVLTPPGPEERVAGMQAAVRPALAARYALVQHTLDPVLGWPVDVFARVAPPPPRPAGPRLDLLTLAPGEGTSVSLEGQVRGARAGLRVEVEVFTNRWYPQGAPVVLESADSRFAYTVHRGMACGAVVRARLLDGAGRALAADARELEPPAGVACP